MPCASCPRRASATATRAARSSCARRWRRTPAGRAGAVVLTPANQYPTGAVLAPERRTALVEWARGRDAVIVEDDYDAQYRYDRDPVGSLQGLAPDITVHGGSASKILAPALGLGWLVLPERLVDTVAAQKARVAGGGSALEQVAFAR